MLAFRERCLRLSGQTDSSDPRIFMLDLTQLDSCLSTQILPSQTSSHPRGIPTIHLPKSTMKLVVSSNQICRISPNDLGFRPARTVGHELGFVSVRRVADSIGWTAAVNFHDTFFFSLSILVDSPSGKPTKISGVDRCLNDFNTSSIRQKLALRTTRQEQLQSWRDARTAATGHFFRWLTDMSRTSTVTDYEDRTDSVKSFEMFGTSLAGYFCKLRQF